MLNLFTPKKPKKKYCAEEEEDLNFATPRVFGVRKVNGKSDKEVEASKSNKEVDTSKSGKEVEVGKSNKEVDASKSGKEVEVGKSKKEVDASKSGKEVEVGKSDAAKCTSPPRVQVEKVEKILSQHPI